MAVKPDNQNESCVSQLLQGEESMGSLVECCTVPGIVSRVYYNPGLDSLVAVNATNQLFLFRPSQLGSKMDQIQQV